MKIPSLGRGTRSLARASWPFGHSADTDPSRRRADMQAPPTRLSPLSIGHCRYAADRSACLDSSTVSDALQRSVRVQLRWRDMDMLGHLNQSAYHELLEEGRAALITEIIRRVGDDHTHGSFVLAHVDLDYHTEVRKDHGEVEIVVRLARVGTSSVQLEHEVRLPDGSVAASGKTVLVAWDSASRGKRRLSEAELAAFS